MKYSEDKKKSKKNKSAKKQMVKAGEEYLRLRNNKPTKAGYSHNYDVNLEKARRKRDSLRAIVRKNSIKKSKRV